MASLAIIGAGAAGCFCAVQLSRHLGKSSRICVFEAQKRPMAKLAITGGGRCNITNSFREINDIRTAYPRGSRLLKSAFAAFSPQQCRQWWEENGVKLVEQNDCCIFPKSQNAMEVVDCLLQGMKRGGVQLFCGTKVISIKADSDSGYLLEIAGKTPGAEHFDYVVVTTGGGAIGLLKELELPIQKPVPSLFTLRIEGLGHLMGNTLDNASLSLEGSKFRSQGILLFTDWGISGPACLKLSSYAARYLNENSYKATLQLNYLSRSEEELRAFVNKARCSHKQTGSLHPEGLSDKVWRHILGRCSINEQQPWAELGNKSCNRLINTLLCDSYPISGRAAFKSEFVTAGGVECSAVKAGTLEAKNLPRLYFAGEVLDIDGITGGFNLQAAWSTAFVVAQSICSAEKNT